MTEEEKAELFIEACEIAGVDANELFKRYKIMKLEIKLESKDNIGEKYHLKLWTYKESIETSIDKENLRYLIEKMDNQII